MHLRQPGFTNSACGPFTKNKERIQKFKEIGDSRYIHKNKLDKSCCQHDMAFGDFKDFPITTTDKLLRDKPFNIAKNLKYNGYQCKIASLLYKFFDKRSSRRSGKSEIMPN